MLSVPQFSNKMSRTFGANMARILGYRVQRLITGNSVKIFGVFLILFTIIFYFNVMNNNKNPYWESQSGTRSSSLELVETV